MYREVQRPCGKQVGGSSKCRTQSHHGSQRYTPKSTDKKNENMYTETHVKIYSVVIHNSRVKQPRSLLPDEWINRWSLYSMNSLQP